jgi:TatA/E family protein of Tat protein translocase
MGNIGGSELLIILVLALLLLGPKRLPEVGEALGRTLRRFRQASGELRDEIDVRHDIDVRAALRREIESPLADEPSATEPRARHAAEPTPKSEPDGRPEPKPETTPPADPEPR